VAASEPEMHNDSVITNSSSAKYLALLSCLLLSVLPAFARRKTEPKASHAAAIDSSYVSALATANRFLYAWQAQDQENGLIMLTDAAKQRTSEDRLQSFFSPGAGVQQTYEIGHGKKMASGRYSFPVELFVSKPAGTSHFRYSQIVIVKAGSDDWAIDKLP
jgi:hypothetical protein